MKSLLLLLILPRVILLLLVYAILPTVSLHILDDNDNGNDDNTISLTLMIPFRDNRRHLDFNSNEYHHHHQQQSVTIGPPLDTLQDGVSLVLAAALAIDDFNRRDSLLIDGLEESLQDCPVHFSDISLIDTERLVSHVLEQRALWENNDNGEGKNSVIVGVQDNQVAQALAKPENNINNIPILSHNAYLLPDTSFTPTSTNNNNNNNNNNLLHLASPSWEGRMNALVKYLQAINSPSAALLYAPGEETKSYFPTLQQAAAIHTQGGVVNVFDAPSPRGDRNMLQRTLQKMRDDHDVKTIIVAWERDDRIEVLAEVVDSLSMMSTTGGSDNHHQQYQWIFLDSYVSPFIVDRFPKKNVGVTSPLGRLLRNARIFQVLDPTVGPPASSTKRNIAARQYEDKQADDTVRKFQQAIQERGANVFVGSIVQHLIHDMTHNHHHHSDGSSGSALPLRKNNGITGDTLDNSIEEMMKRMKPVYGTGFLYDSILAIGIGACSGGSSSLEVQQQEANTTSTSTSVNTTSLGEDEDEDHDQRRTKRRRSLSSHSTIGHVDFEGVTGRFRLDEDTGARSPSDVQYGVYFIRKFALDDTFWTSLFDRTDVDTGEWILEERVEDLYIPVYARVFGIVLTMIGIVFSLASAIFVYRRRGTTQVRMSQPAFMYAVCFGASLMSLSIFFQSFDDLSIENNNNKNTLGLLDKFCCIEVWLTYCGQVIIYMALFSKLWRIKQIAAGGKGLKVLPHHVIPPFAFLVVCVLTILIVWTILDPPRFIRLEVGVNNDGTEAVTMPFCTFHPKYQATLQAVLFLCIFLVCFMVYMTRKLPDEITDRKAILRVLFSHFAIIVIGVGLYTLGVFVATWSFAYFGRALISFAYAMCSVGFLMLPKMLSRWGYASAGNQSTSQFSSGVVHVSGLEWDDSSSMRPSSTFDDDDGGGSTSLRKQIE